MRRSYSCLGLGLIISMFIASTCFAGMQTESVEQAGIQETQEPESESGKVDSAAS